MTGANSAVGLRSLPARFIFMDEIDGYPPDADGEGNPIDLAMARARTFTRRKYFMPSTPTVHGHSNVEREFEGSDQRYFHVPCPECGEYQKLVFAGLKWDEGRPETAWYECEHCQAKIKNHQKTKMLKAGQWVAENPESKVAGFHLNALYSPVGWYSWPEIVRDFLEAKKSPEKLKAFVNTVLAETWREESERPSANRLWERREGYRRNVVPQKVGFLTCGCDVQADRIELEVVGWCREKETFSVDYRVLPGDTSQPGVWAELDKVVYETWECEGTPARMPLKLMGVDSGYLTQTVYNWVRKHPATRVIAVKGVETSNVIVGIPRPADVTIKGKTIRRGVKVWSVGTNLIKSELYSWLRLDSPSEGEPVPHGFCHFPEYDEEFFKQLTAEEARVKFVKGYKRIEWEKVRERNEALDCRVYARAAASVCGLDRFTEQNWKALETERQIGGDLETENKPRRKKRKRESIW